MDIHFQEGLLPLRLSFSSPMTDDGLLEFSGMNKGWRIEREPNGELLIMTPAGFRTGKINQRISEALGNWAGHDDRGIVVGPDTGFRLPDGSIRAPDAAWMSSGQLAHITDDEQEGYLALCPEFIIEIRSNKDRLPPLKAKMEMWLANGAALAWLVDPKSRSVTIYRPGETPEELHDPTSVQGTGPVAGFELIMARIWG